MFHEGMPSQDPTTKPPERPKKPHPALSPEARQAAADVSAGRAAQDYLKTLEQGTGASTEDARFQPPTEGIEGPIELADVSGRVDQKKLDALKQDVTLVFDRLNTAVSVKGPAFDKALAEWRQLEQDVTRATGGRQDLAEPVIRAVQKAAVERDFIPRRRQMEAIWKSMSSGSPRGGN